MKKLIFAAAILLLMVSASLPMALPVMADTPTFSGNVETDFTGSGILTIADRDPQDVFLPSNAPGGTISGWDMKDLRLAYDPATDTMYVGINTYVIAGDADGDGDPGGTSPWLATNGGTDPADFGGTESFAVYFDLDLDGTYDIIAGVSAFTDISGFSVSTFAGSPDAPAFAFGAPIPGQTGSPPLSPSVSWPDLEFTISPFPGTGAFPSFHVCAYMGSFEDNGIGEDSICVLPDISVNKTANPTSVPEPGADVDFTITVSNDCNWPLTIDTLSDSDFDLSIPCFDAVGTVLDVGENYSCTFTQHIEGNAGNPPHQNTATAFAYDDYGGFATDDDDATVTFYGVSGGYEYRGIVAWAPYMLSLGNEIVSHLFDLTSGGLTWSRSASGQFVVNGNLPNLTQKSSDILGAVMTIAHNSLVFMAQLSTLLPSPIR